MDGIAIYARLDGEDADLLQEQIDTLAAELDRRGAEDWLVFSDLGVNGLVPLAQRGGGSALLQAAQGGRISAVYVAGLDRLGRTADVLVEARRQLSEAGCAIYSAAASDGARLPG